MFLQLVTGEHPSITPVLIYVLDYKVRLAEKVGLCNTTPS
ncbi:Protein-serine/threonine phosphatase [Psidium guajava]|nr:Protein-serine/threonine phosphatase [Psidium guajava]